ncbi:MAG: hypothetical protein LQ344_004842 [Seirophora lacunosa]|nr:MAG: hypothetical protein LQ344_004842 [Seirophora lacunosa]
MATQNVSKRLLSLAKERLDSAEANEPTPRDTIQWIIGSRKNATAEEVAQEALAYIFASAYQMPMIKATTRLPMQLD